MHRTLILGGPRVGKTTLSASIAASVGVVAKHTDDLIGNDVPEESIVQWMAALGPWVIEGVTAVRALRRWVHANADGIPCERIFWSEQPKVEQSDGQQRMAKGCRTVWKQIESDLRARGVLVQSF